MILKEQKLIETDGNIAEEEEIKMSVDIESTDKLFDILIGSYKSIRNSFVREYTSNCVDAHTEIDSKEPVIVLIDEDDGGKFISFIDKGVGMTYDFVKKIFSSLLKSTKNGNNDAIGGFGVGSKSGLGYQSQLSLRTIKDGFLNEYLIYRETSGLPKILPIITNQEIEEHSGTTVKIYLKTERVLTKHSQYSWQEQYEDEDTYLAKIIVQELCYFDNVVLEFRTGHTRNIPNLYNDSKIIEGTYFKTKTYAQYNNEIHIIFGRVSYPVDWKELGIEPINIPIGVKFNIGDFQVNMTRESIIYSDETKILLKERINLAIQELVEIYNRQNEPIQDLMEYCKKKRSFEKNPKYLIQLPENMELDITCLSKKEEVKLNPLIYAPIAHLNINLKKDILPFFNYHPRMFKLENGRERKCTESVYEILNKNNPDVFLNCTSEDILSKDFRNYEPNCYFINESKLKFSEICYNLGIKYEETNRILFEGDKDYNYTDRWGDVHRQYLKYHSYPLGTGKLIYKYKKIIKEELLKSTTLKDFKTFNIPQEWIEEQKKLEKEARLAAKVVKEKGVISVYNSGTETRYDLEIGSDHYPKQHRKSKQENIKTLPANFNGIVIVGFKDDAEDLKKFAELVKNYKPYSFVENKKVYRNNSNYNYDWKDVTFLNENIIRVYQIAQNNLKPLVNSNLPHIYHISEIMELSVMQKFLTALTIKDNKNCLFLKQGEVKLFNEHIAKLIKEVSEYYANNNFKNEDLLKELVTKFRKNEDLNVIVDKNIQYKLKQIDTFFENAELIRYCTIKEESIPYIVDYLRIKKKKVNLNFYEKGKGIEDVNPKPFSLGQLVECPIPDLQNYNYKGTEIRIKNLPIKEELLIQTIKNEEIIENV